MAKTDLKKVLAPLYDVGAKAKSNHIVEVPALRYLMVDGAGDPNTSPQYRDAISTLYPIAYWVKFAAKASGDDFGVMPL